jgi:hypothetical protein
MTSHNIANPNSKASCQKLLETEHRTAIPNMSPAHTASGTIAGIAGFKVTPSARAVRISRS